MFCPRPMPHAIDDACLQLAEPGDVPNAFVFTRAVVVVLNYGYGCPTESNDVIVAKPTPLQRLCVVTIGARVAEFVKRLRSDVPVACSCKEAWESYQARRDAPRLDLLADLVDYPEAAGTCDCLVARLDLGHSRKGRFL